MKRLLIKQAVYLPIIYFGFILMAGFFAEDYSHLGQHASELGINANNVAINLFRIGIVATSFSLFLFSAGLVLTFKGQFSLFSFLIFLFGVTFIFGAIFPIGSPWHGLYGLGLFVMIIPFVFLYEQNNLIDEKFFHLISVLAGFLIFVYLWAMVARLDPVNYRGLTQRLFGIVVFGWLAYVAFRLDKYLDEISFKQR
ncbi:MAG: DUF998 domain-containing protein, partial [Fidelibacterota bacterium]